MMNAPMFETMMDLAKDPQFQQCVPLSEAKEETAYRQELVLRFFSHEDYEGGEGELDQEHGEWLTSWMRRTAQRPPTEVARIVNPSLFHRTFGLLATASGEDSFRLYNGERHLGPFSISSFEFVTSGVAHNLELWESRSGQDLRSKIQGIWRLPDFRNNSGTGVSPRRRVPRLIVKARQYFAF